MQIDKKTIRNLFIAAAGCIFLYWFLHETERLQGLWSGTIKLVWPFILGAIFAFILNVPMRGIERKLNFIQKPGLQRILSIFLTFIFLLLILFGVIWLLIPQISETIQALQPKLVDFFVNAEASIRGFLYEHPEIMEWVNANTDLESLNWAGIIEKAVTMVTDSLSAIAGGAFTAVGSIVGIILDFVIALVFSLYCLSRKEILARQGRRVLYAVLPERISDEIIRIFRLTNTTFSNFISGQCLEVCILGVLFAVTMTIFKMPYVPLVSVLIGITALIPIVGAFVGCIFGAFFILVNDPLQAVWFVIMFLVLQQIEGNLIYPRVVGTSIGLPGMWVLVAVTVGGEFLGISGMLLMIPIASVLYTLAREYTNKRLAKRQVNPEKLMDHPPELKSKFKQNREIRKEQKLLKQMKQLTTHHSHSNDNKE